MRIYELNGKNWEAMGATIEGTTGQSEEFGFAVSISGDGTKVVGGSAKKSKARVYEWNSGAWSQLGADIVGRTTAERFGHAVALNGDGSHLVVSAPQAAYDGQANAGVIRVFKYTNGTWKQLGQDVGLRARANAQFGTSVSISEDGTRISASAPYVCIVRHGTVYRHGGGAPVERGHLGACR